MTAPVVIWTLPLGSAAELRLSLDSFNGKARADLRTWADYQAGPVLTRGPTKKGVSVPVEALPALVAAVVEAEAVARSSGLLGKGGARD